MSIGPVEPEIHSGCQSFGKSIMAGSLRESGSGAASIAPSGSLPLVADARLLATLLDSGLRTIRSWDASGQIPAPIRIGGSVRWRVDEIRAWLDAGAPDRQTWAAIRAAKK